MADLGPLRGSRQWSRAEPLKKRKLHELLNVSYTISRDCTNAAHTSRKRLCAISSKSISNKQLTRALEPISAIDKTRMSQMNPVFMEPQTTPVFESPQTARRLSGEPGMNVQGTIQQQPGLGNAQINRQIMQGLESQGPFRPVSGWQAAVRLPERAAQIRQLVDNLRLVRPPVEPPKCVEVAIQFERKAFAQSENKESYIREFNEKVTRIRDQRAQQMNINSNTNTLRDSNPVGILAAAANKLHQQDQSNPDSSKSNEPSVSQVKPGSVPQSSIATAMASVRLQHGGASSKPASRGGSLRPRRNSQLWEWLPMRL